MPRGYSLHITGGQVRGRPRSHPTREVCSGSGYDQLSACSRHHHHNSHLQYHRRQRSGQFPSWERRCQSVHLVQDADSTIWRRFTSNVSPTMQEER